MKNYNMVTPEGTKDTLFQECIVRRQVESKLKNIFTSRGYNEVITPGLEYYDVFNIEGAAIPQYEMYKATDNKGRLVVFRPDLTLPIARLAATRLKSHTLPIKLYYNQTIYRNRPDLSGRSDEAAQGGIELIGAGGIKADLEVISTAVQVLKECELSFRFEIGHAGLFSVFANKLGVSSRVIEEIRNTIESKNYAALSDLLDKLEPSVYKEAIKSLPRLFGGSEVFEKAAKFCIDEKSKEILSYLEGLYTSLENLDLSNEIIVDLGLVQRNDYYTGVVFSAYANGHGAAVLMGGRYDNLMEKFNAPMPAVGFGVDVDAVSDIIMSDVSQNKGVKPLRIALTKGRLEKKTVELLQQIGLDCTQVIEKGRRLILPIGNGEIEVVLAKAADVITYVEHGVCDLGVVGKDTIMENGSHFYEILDLGFGKCKFALACKKEDDFYSGYKAKVIASKYPNVTRQFFESKAMDVKIIKIEGSVELAPLLALSDGIVDIVETGSTLKENGLEVREDIANISARLIANEASLKLRKKEIEELVDKLEAKG